MRNSIQVLQLSGKQSIWVMCKSWLLKGQGEAGYQWVYVRIVEYLEAARTAAHHRKVEPSQDRSDTCSHDCRPVRDPTHSTHVVLP